MWRRCCGWWAPTARAHPVRPDRHRHGPHQQQRAQFAEYPGAYPPEGRQIRRAFVAGPGHVLVDADYSQIELRVLAHMSQDQTLCDAFLRGQDIHRRTAAEVYGVPIGQVTGEMRSGGQGGKFRHHLRHIGFWAGPEHRVQPEGGRRVH